MASNGEIIQKAAPWLDWALCNVGWSIVPPCPDLPYPVPDYDLVRKLSLYVCMLINMMYDFPFMFAGLSKGCVLFKKWKGCAVPLDLMQI